MTIVRLFFAMAPILLWPLCELDINNAFLHEDIEEEIYMEQPSGLVCELRHDLSMILNNHHVLRLENSAIVQIFGFSEIDYLVFCCHASME